MSRQSGYRKLPQLFLAASTTLATVSRLGTPLREDIVTALKFDGKTVYLPNSDQASRKRLSISTQCMLCMCPTNRRQLRHSDIQGAIGAAVWGTASTLSFLSNSGRKLGSLREGCRVSQLSETNTRGRAFRNTRGVMMTKTLKIS